MNPGSLTPAPTLNHCYFCSRQMATEVVRGRTQEALKPPGACYLLLPGLEGAGIESLVSRASFCALRTPQPRGELERLLTTLNCSADRPQIGMGRAMMCLLQPLPGLSKRKAQLWASAAKVLTRTRRRSPRGRELARGYPGRGHTVTSPARVGPRGSDVALLTTTGPRCFWGFGFRQHPGSDRSPSRRLPAQRKRGRRPTYPAARGGPPRSQPRFPGESAPQPWNSQSSAGPWCELCREPSKNERGDSVGQSATAEERGACPGSAPFPPSASKPECEDSQAQSAVEQRQGAWSLGPLPFAPDCPSVALGGAPPLTSVPSESVVSLARVWGGAAFLPWGAAVAAPAAYT